MRRRGTLAQHNLLQIESESHELDLSRRLPWQTGAMHFRAEQSGECLLLSLGVQKKEKRSFRAGRCLNAPLDTSGLTAVMTDEWRLAGF